VNIFTGKLCVWRALALNGSYIKYDIHKMVKDKIDVAWSTISRRVDDLVARGYLCVTGTRKIQVGKRIDDSPTYGITWNGLIAFIESTKFPYNIVTILQQNPQLELPS